MSEGATAATAREAKPGVRLPYVALAAVCLFWGTTYLGIRVSLESFPPLYLIATRYVISGAIMLAISRARGALVPSGRELWLTAGCGVICIGVGNGLLATAQTMVPSGFAALCYTTGPFWMVGVDALLPGGKRPKLATVGGLLVGVAGVAILIVPSVLRTGLHGALVLGFILIQISAAGWISGALLQKRVKAQAEPIVSGAVQQVAAGLATFVPAMLLEHAPTSITIRSAVAVTYLVIFGSLVGFSAFIYAVAKLPVAIVSIYTFVNPVVAVGLGWLIFREPFGMRELIAMLVVFAGIFLVRRSEAS